MLYKFDLLTQMLNQSGFPQAAEGGFRVIRRDLTQEEKAGNIEFKPEGVYLAVDGVLFKGYMYLKFPDLKKFGLPKFHITKCKIIEEQRSSGRFDGRYFWHNTNSVTLEDRTNGEKHVGVLSLCRYCRDMSSIEKYGDTQGFFDHLDRQEQQDIGKEIVLDILGYTTDWKSISYQYRKEKAFSCELCGIQIENKNDQRFFHAHHKNGNKLNNQRSNLECLCVLCHAHVDETHISNFSKNRMQKEVRSFINKYRNRLLEVQNKYVKNYN